MKFFLLGLLIFFSAFFWIIPLQLAASIKTDLLINCKKTDFSERTGIKSSKKPPKLTIIFVPDEIQRVQQSIKLQIF